MTAVRGVVLAATTSHEAFVQIAGVSLLERQVRTLRLAGIRETVVIVQEGSDIEEEVEQLRHRGMALDAVAAREGRFPVEDLPPQFLGGENLVTDASILVDPRIVGLMAEGVGESICLIPEDGIDPEDGRRVGLLETSASCGIFSGCARLRTDAMADLDVSSRQAIAVCLARLLSESPGRSFCLDDPPYDPDRKAAAPWLFIAVDGNEDDRRATKVLLAAAQKEVLDWPALLVHRSIENAIVSRLCLRAVTPNQVTFLTNVLAFTAAGFFATGRTGLGLALALAVGVCDGLDGKLARLKLHFSPIGHWEHHFDKIYENAWWVAIAWNLADDGMGWAWAAWALLVSAGFFDLALAGWFRRRRGIQHDDAGPFERRFRLVAGRRNTYVWTLLPFVLLGQTAAGYGVISLYAAASAAVRAWRVLRALRAGDST